MSEICTWKPPFTLPTTPLSDEEAAAIMLPGGMSLLEAFENQTEIDGECVCGPEYEPPECNSEPCEGQCSYIIAGYTSDNGTFGILTGTLRIRVTHDGTPSGTVVGDVYLNVSSTGCEGDCGVGCPAGTKYSTSLAYWGIGGFPSHGGSVGAFGGNFDCE